MKPYPLSLSELIIGGKNGLEPVEKTIIDRCTRLVYRDYLADPRPEKVPILQDLYDLLREQPEPEAQRIANALEIYVTGSSGSLMNILSRTGASFRAYREKFARFFDDSAMLWVVPCICAQ